MKRIKITNRTDSPMVFKYDGKVYEIGPKESATLSPDVAAHAFGVVVRDGKLEIDKELFKRAALMRGYGWMIVRDPNIPNGHKLIPERFEEFRKSFSASLIEVKEVEVA